MEALAVSTWVVALGEVGDKTQLLAMMLAAKYRRPWPIIGGIFLATVANHALAAGLGQWVASAMGPQVLLWVIGLAFLAMAIWIMIPDQLEDEQSTVAARWGVLVTTVIAFFMAEMGDKTQVATVALAARYPEMLQVVLGTTLGMMLANVPAVMLGDRLSHKIPMKWVHALVAVLFAGLGVATLLDVGQLSQWLH